MKIQKRIFFYLIGVLILFILASSFVGYKKVSFVIGEVGNYPITEAELLFYMQNKQADIRNEYQKNYGITLSNDMWQKELNGSIPEEVLKEAALQNCIAVKSEFILAKDLGIINYVDYSDFLARMEKENKERARSVREGEIVYGLLKYEPAQYLSHVAAELEQQIKEVLAEGTDAPLHVSEEEAESYFTEHKEEWLNNGITYEVLEVQLPESERVQERLKQVTEILTTESDIDELRARLEDKELILEHSFTNDSYMQDMRACYVIRMAVESMKEGEVKVALENGVYHVIYLRKLLVEEEKAYKEYQLRIIETIQNEKYEKYLSVYQEGLQVNIHTGRYEKVQLHR